MRDTSLSSNGFVKLIGWLLAAWTLTFLGTKVFAGTRVDPKHPFADATPTIDVSRAVYIKGPILSNNLAPLSAFLLKAAGENDRPISLVIDSPGGGLGSGFPFVSVLEDIKSRGIEVDCFVGNIAASLAFHILMQCDRKVILNNSNLLWHPVRVGSNQPITHSIAAYIAEELAKADSVIYGSLANIRASEDYIKYHFEKETFHYGQVLCEETAGFECYDVVANLQDILAGRVKVLTSQPLHARLCYR
jgi:ATP-dependent protease ClpP protease subunit